MEAFNIPKYFNYIRGYQKTANLYGFSHSHAQVNEGKMLVVFEGEKSVLKQFTMTRNKGFSCSVGSHDLSDLQVQIILANTTTDTEIVIAFDRDVQDMKDKDGSPIGKEYLVRQCNKLSKYRRVSYVWDEYNILDKTSSPIDKGVKVWNHLLKYRRKL